MRKFASLILAFAVTVGLTACSYVKNPTDDTFVDSKSVLDHSGNNSEISSNSNNQTSVTQTQLAPETKAMIDSFALDSFTAPDGSTVSKSEAAYALGTDGNTFAVGFDFSYMRYAKPIFTTTFDDPSLINWETLEFSTETYTPVESPDYFKVKTGDTLENGLTVESAKFWIDSSGELYSSEIVFSGNLTLEGVLYCTAGDPDYVDVQGDLIFFADTIKSNLIPVPKDFSVDFTEGHVDTLDKFAASFDGKRIHLGNISEVSVDLSNKFDSGNYIKAKVTMRGMRLMYNENGGALIYAEPVSVEKL